jgi:hypothetical protein
MARQGWVSDTDMYVRSPRLPIGRYLSSSIPLLEPLERSGSSIDVRFTTGTSHHHHRSPGGADARSNVDGHRRKRGRRVGGTWPDRAGAYDRVLVLCTFDDDEEEEEEGLTTWLPLGGRVAGAHPGSPPPRHLGGWGTGPGARLGVRSDVGYRCT